MKQIIILFALWFSYFSLLKAEPSRPNILWITAEDANVNWFGCYGNKVGQSTTPNIDKLAAEGFLYRNAFATAPVCAASRSSLITGVYSLTTGTYNHRSSYAIPHKLIEYYPDALRRAGYFCSNHTKTDYNIGGRKDMDCWDSSEQYGWKKRAQGQPFFCVINYMESHESRVMGSVENTRHDPSKVVLEKYHPDLPTIRKNYSLYQDAVENMDKRVGYALAALKESGLEEDTIVIFCTDHGGVMPGSKHYANDAGLHSPLIIRIPEKFKKLWPAEKPGIEVDRLVSFVDMPKTWLSLTQTKIPDTMQGKIFLGPQVEPEPEYCFSYQGRMDERYDEVRVVRDKRFIYIKNYQPYLKMGQHLHYLWRIPATVAWWDHFKAGKCDEVRGKFFKTKVVVEELYDGLKDPDCVNNLSEQEEFKPVLFRMGQALTNWQLTIYDAGLLPESEMLRRAEANRTTIYEMVRNSKIYNLPAYLTAADVALAKNVANLPKLTNYLSDSDSCLRYWGACGMVMLGKLDDSAIKALKKCLRDESHDVRAMAAWALIKAGHESEGQASLIEMIQQNSYASLRVLNVMDWIGGDTSPYQSALQSMQKSKDVKRELDQINPKAVSIMQEYLMNPQSRKDSSYSSKRGVIEKDEEFLRMLKLDPYVIDSNPSAE